MCTYLTLTNEVTGSGFRGGDDWFRLAEAVVSFDHPQDAMVEHALCIDFRGDGPASRVAVELDAASARRLATSILAALDSPEAIELTA
jgi:hypothetical protein